ncbi:MAG TPA: hypothetical protein VI298_10050 [Geobacteraceae bacterium]
MDNEIHAELRRRIADGTIAAASKKELEAYSNALCVAGTAAIYGNSYNAVFSMVQMLLNTRISEESDNEARKIKEEIDSIRHQEIQNKLEELKKPHWSTTYNFAATVIAAVASCLAVGLTVYQIRASKPSSEGQKSGSQMSAVQPYLSSSHKPLLHTQSQLSTTRKKKP